MIVRCKACAKRYHLEDNIIGSRGHNVRCTGCGHVWHQTPMPPSMNPLLTLPLSLPLPSDKRSHLSKKVFWGLGFLVILSGSFLLYRYYAGRDREIFPAASSGKP